MKYNSKIDEYFDFYKNQTFLLSKFNIKKIDEQPKCQTLIRVSGSLLEESELRVLVARLVYKIEDSLLSHFLELPSFNTENLNDDIYTLGLQYNLNSFSTSKEEIKITPNRVHDVTTKDYTHCLVIGDCMNPISPDYNHLNIKLSDNICGEEKFLLLTKDFIGNFNIYRGESLNGLPEIWFRESSNIMQLGIGFKFSYNYDNVRLINN